MTGTSRKANRSSNINNSNTITTDTKAAAATRHAAETVIAATAGRDNWQTWAGRKHGTEDFEYLDVFRGIKHSLRHGLGTKVPKRGTTCPICFCEPDDASSWHVTWCGHAVCKDCLGRYATNQVGDKEQSGPLKCPVCLKVLRKKDAIVAMMAGKHNANQTDLIRQWDMKMRDQLLRAIPSFRSCPKCGGSGSSTVATASSSEGVGVGGGFVTPECLGPQHQERREQAIQILLQRNYAYAAIVVLYLTLVGTIARTPSLSANLDLWSMLLPLYVFAKIGMAVNHLLATKARAALFRSISVECPCCDESFVLPAESTSTQLMDDETSRWVDTNTRPCPSCSVPIAKSGGCNHMKCSHCGVGFCWACMRLQTTCRAYKCQNGGRDASILDDLRGEDYIANHLGGPQALQSEGSVITYIDYILNHRVCPELMHGDGLLIVTCLCARHFRGVQFLEREVLSPVLFYLCANVHVFVALFLVTGLGFAVVSRRAHFAQQFFERRGERLGHDQTIMYFNVLFIALISLFSLPVGVSMCLGYFVNEILPILQPQRRGQPLQERETERGRPVPVNPNHGRPLVDELNQTMLNEALRRSVEDT